MSARTKRAKDVEWLRQEFLQAYFELLKAGKLDDVLRGRRAVMPSATKNAEKKGRRKAHDE